MGLVGIERPLFNAEVLSASSPGSAVLICEGVPDVLAAHQLGHQAVGALGVTGFKENWIPLFRGLRVFAVPDMDAPGREFGRKLQHLFAAKGEVVEVLTLAKGKDLAEYLAKTSKRSRSKGRK